MKHKRLFLIAGYNSHNKIDAALVFMLQQLSESGDIIFVMDNDTDKTELEKISPYILYADAHRHNEYDFGSYKRAYMYARNACMLEHYEFVYLINDSVYGPLYPIEKYFEQMESFNTPAFGLVKNPHNSHPHIQSWFIGMRPSVFLSDWFNEFITSIKHQPDKVAITYMYEQGFTRLLNRQHINWQCMFSASGRSIYNNVKKLYKSGLPFLKKVAFTRHNGRLGRQILYILNHINADARNSILASASDLYGDQYINWLLTKNPVKIIFRNIKYFLQKICKQKQ